MANEPFRFGDKATLRVAPNPDEDVVVIRNITMPGRSVGVQTGMVLIATRYGVVRITNPWFLRPGWLEPYHKKRRK